MEPAGNTTGIGTESTPGGRRGHRQADHHHHHHHRYRRHHDTSPDLAELRSEVWFPGESAPDYVLTPHAAAPLAHCCTIFLKSSGYRHRNPNIHIKEIIWLGNQLLLPWIILNSCITFIE